MISRLRKISRFPTLGASAGAVLSGLILASLLIAVGPGAPLRAQEEPEQPRDREPRQEQGAEGRDLRAQEEDALEAPEVEDIDAILRGEEEIFGAFEGYAYDPGDRRDPFRSLLVTRQEPELRGPRPEGVPGLLIDEVNLVGILKTPKGYIAQVQAADREKSYLLREGEQLFDGEVVSIGENEVVFKQEVRDPTAVKPFRERVKILNPG